MNHIFPTIGSGFWSLNLSVAAMIILASVITFVICRVCVANLDVRKPGKMQNFLEWVIDFVRGFAKDFIDPKHVDKFVPLALTLILYIFISNQLGVIMNINTVLDGPILGVPEEALQEHGGHAVVSWWLSPTANLSVTAALALGIFFLSLTIGLRHPKAYFSHFKNPMHLIEEVSKPVTHALRLWGNIFAGEVLMGMIMSIPVLFGFIPVSAIPLIVWLAYSLFVGSIQAFIFTVLAMLYIGQKYPNEHH